MIKETPETTETVVEQESVEKPAVTPVPAASDEQLVAMLVDRARSEGLHLTGEGGLLQMLTKRVLESVRTTTSDSVRRHRGGSLRGVAESVGRS